MPIRPLDLIDITLVAILLYQGYKLVLGTRAMNLVRGLVIFALTWYAASRLQLVTLSWLLGNLATVGLFALVVVFQPELRAALERIGRSRVRDAVSPSAYIGEVARAVERLAERKVGALIAFERRTPLGEYAATGVSMDAAVTAPTLETIFARNTPLHDGGVIIRAGRIATANCLFPLQNLPDGVYRRYGTRHRAALGISDLSDALVVVVSEERGVVRVAEAGRLSPDLTSGELRERLRAGLTEAPEGATVLNLPWWGGARPAPAAAPVPPAAGGNGSNGSTNATPGPSASATGVTPPPGATREEPAPETVEGPHG